MFLSEAYRNRIEEIDALGNVTTVAGNGTAGFVDGTGGPNGTAEFHAPAGVAIDSSGSLVIGDSSNLRVRKISF